MSLLRGIAKQAHTESCRSRIEEELKGTAKAHAATRRMKEYQDRAAGKGTKRTCAWKIDRSGRGRTNFEFKWQWRRDTNAEFEQ